MAKCAVCVDNVVVNIVIAALDEQAPVANGVLIDIDNIADCDIGWIYTGDSFVNPNPPEWSDV
jgi:hypothetical protein